MAGLCLKIFIFLFSVVSCHATLCPAQFSAQGSHCFHISSLPATWIDSFKYCMSLGGRLVVIENAAKLENFMSFRSEVEATMQPDAYVGYSWGHYWTAANLGRPRNGGTSVWQWQLADGSRLPLSYTGGRAPTVTSEAARHGSYRALLIRKDGRWYYGHASVALHPFCEADSRA